MFVVHQKSITRRRKIVRRANVAKTYSYDSVGSVGLGGRGGGDCGGDSGRVAEALRN